MNERKYFKKRRKALGYTQTTLAKELGINNNTISRYEKGLSELRCKNKAYALLGITGHKIAFVWLLNA